MRDGWDYTHLLSLEKGFDYIWKNNFNKACKRTIRKAEKSGIEILNYNSIENFREFYKLYVERAKIWGTTETWMSKQPLKFYENLHKFGGRNVQLYLANKDDAVIAGLVTINYGKNIFYWMMVI